MNNISASSLPYIIPGNQNGQLEEGIASLVGKKVS
jgi:hypothetical protein